MSYATVDELAAALRVRVTTENQDTLQKCLDAAASEIDHEIDWPVGAAAPAGQYLYSSSTAAGDPGDGGVAFDKSSPAAVKFARVDSLSMDGVDLEADLAGLGAGDLLRIATSSGAAWAQFLLTDTAAVQVGWVELPVDYDGGDYWPEDGTLVELSFLRLTRPVLEGLALANRVNVLRGVEWYKAQDAAFGVIGFAETGALQAPRDGFARHAYTLTPLKRQWGIA